MGCPYSGFDNSEDDDDEYFSAEEAAGKMGKRISTRTEPECTGRVCGMQHHPEGKGIAIEIRWDRDPQHPDRFSKTEYQKSLEEL